MNEENTQEVFAMLIAQRFLLSVLYAQTFAADTASMRRLFVALQRLTREAPSTAEPTALDALIEQQARVATHLQRFEQDVLHRIASGRAS